MTTTDDKLRALLESATCPNKAIGCDGEQWPEYDARGNVVGVQCQWCYERKEVLSTRDAAPEALAEQYIAAEIDRAPEPMRRLGDYLAEVLDEDEVKTAHRMLLGAIEAANKLRDAALPEPECFPKGRRYTVEPHGRGYAIYRGREYGINGHHGLNVGSLTECLPETAALVEAALNAHTGADAALPVGYSWDETFRKDARDYADKLRPAAPKGTVWAGVVELLDDIAKLPDPYTHPPAPRVDDAAVERWPSGVLNKAETLAILTQHNAWRRGAEGPQTDPRMLGLALDAAIAALQAAQEQTP